MKRGIDGKFWMALAVAAALAAGVAYGQAAEGAGAAAASAGAGERMTLREMIALGGWLMYVLTALSVAAVALAMYFAMVLKPSKLAPVSLRKLVLQKVREGDLDGARASCERRPCAFSRIAIVAMDYVKHAEPLDAMLLKDMIEGEGGRQAVSIQGSTQYLLDIAVIAPMVGLVGTIFGMIRAFGGIAYNVASAKPVELAAGVAQALITTAYGLLVGIPAMAFYAYFRRKASELVSYLEMAASDLLAALTTARKGDRL